MRYTAIYGRQGTIASLVAGPSDGPAAMVELSAGQRAVEVDPADAGLDPATFADEESARRALASLRVDVDRGGRLVRQDGESAG